MKLKVYLVTLVLLLLSAGAAFAVPPESCKNGKWIGSYTRSVEITTTFTKTFVFQYNFNADGNVIVYFSGYPELANTTGTGTPFFGSWVCRNDGHIIVTFLGANFGPTGTDTELASHQRQTSEYVVVDKNTLMRIKARSRFYDPTEDPGDPAAGTLGSLSTAEIAIKRLVADANELNP